MRRGVLKGVSLAGVVAAVAVLASLAANAATAQERWPGVLDRVRQQPWWWVGGLGAVAVLAASVAAWRQERPSAGAADPPPPPAPPVPEWVVDRTEGDRAVAAVCSRRRRGAVAITTSLEGAGGFGKTTLAKAVCAHPRVRRRFRGRIYVVTLGRDLRGRAAVAAKVAQVTQYITGDTRTFDDPHLAGAHLGRLLDQRPRTLLVLDDVWEEEQLAPFLQGGGRCVRLVTTRIPALLPPGAARVRVDEMSPAQARAVLAWGLPPLPEDLVRALLRATGRWALLLRLTNRLIAGQVATGADPAAVAREALDRLRVHGPAAGEGRGPVDALDLDDPGRRARAVRATVEAATSLLPAGGAARLAELGVFVEDESIPVPLVARLWAATGGLSESEARALCAVLDRLSLVSLSPQDGGRAALHDVLRDYLRGELGGAELQRLHGILADTVGDEPWTLTDGYLLDHLIEHLLAASRPRQAQTVVEDIRWVETRLHQRGPSAPWQDVRRIPTATAAALALELNRIAHLLGPIEPAPALTATLYSRLQHESHWGAQIRYRRHEPALRPLLSNRWDLPDLPDGRLLRTLTGHTARIRAIAVAPSGDRLATADADGTVRLWDVESGRCLRVFETGARVVNAVALSRDGRWLAVGGAGPRLTVWNTATGARAAEPAGHRLAVNGMGFAPAGSWLATGSGDGTVRLWEPGTWRCTRVLDADGPVYAMQVGEGGGGPGEAGGGGESGAGGAGGAWLATADSTTLRLWSTDTWTLTDSMGIRHTTKPVFAVLPGADTAVTGNVVRVDALRFGQRAWNRTLATDLVGLQALAVAPDSRWLAAADRNGVQLRDLVNGTLIAHLRTRNTSARTVAFGPDSSWLATGAEDGAVQLWAVRGSFASGAATHSEPQSAVAFAPHGSWLATGTGRGAVHVWGRATGRRTTELSYDVASTVRAVAVAADGSRLAAVRENGPVRVWDTGRWTHTDLPGTAYGAAFAPDGSWLAAALASGDVVLWGSGAWQRRTLTGNGAGLRAVAVTPDGSRLATGDANGTVRIWSTATWTAGPDLAGHRGAVRSLAGSPDGSRIASAGQDGTLRIWDTATGACLHTLTGHDGPVNAVAASPDGVWLATAGEDGTVRLWDARTSCPATALRTEAPLRSCAWSPEGTDLAAAGLGGLYLFQLHT
ncbi:NB-ARC domain-containing protein [Streptomyces sp. NPDC032472]|uniref:WD40 domain-containing protein n=1 Tax=Streptomyces sp. NPDC032472 TaxID=3155018 RepID=UPI00340AFD92